MTSTPFLQALPATATKVIPARFAGKTCEYCGTAITPNVDTAFLLSGTWHNACAACAASHVAQVKGLLGKVETVAASITNEAQVAILAEAAANAEADILAVLQGTHAAPATVVDTLQRMLTAATALAPAPAAPVRSNAYAGTCATCGTRVAAGAGRIDKVGGKWTTYHLDGQCPEAPATPAAPAGEAPVGLHLVDGKVVKVYITQNGRKAGKVLQGTSFTYQRGATVGLSEATLMTAEQARAYGRQTGTCCNCGEQIGHGDTESTLRSLAQGYGPVCAQRNGWPTVTTSEAVAILQAEGIQHPLLVQADADECAGGECHGILQQCSKHSAQYQARYGRAANE